MDSNNLNKISSNLLKVIHTLNTNVISHAEQTKGMPFPPSHVRVILHLSHTGPLSITQLAQHLDISKPNMTPIIDKLINADMVVRKEDPNDRRVIRIELTDKAYKVIEDKKQEFIDMLASKISTLSDEDLKSLDAITVELSTIVSKIKE